MNMNIFIISFFAEQPVNRILTRFRADNKIYLPFYRLSICQSSFIYNAILRWNMLPLEIRNENNFNIFKVSIKNMFLT